MPKKLYRMKCEVWVYPGESANWHFVSVDRKTAAEIKERYGGRARGFGSLPVTVTIGKTTWHTSIFPDKRSGTYLLPLKAIVRQKERIKNRDFVNLFMVVS